MKTSGQGTWILDADPFSNEVQLVLLTFLQYYWTALKLTVYQTICSRLLCVSACNCDHLFSFSSPPSFGSFFPNVFYNPGQNLLRQKFKIQWIQEMTQFFKFQFLHLTLHYQCWIWPRFVIKSLNFCQQHWLWGRGAFSLKNTFSLLSQQSCPRLL